MRNSLPPGSKMFSLAVDAILNSSVEGMDDPDSSMLVSLTLRELGIVSFGNVVLCYMFPELQDVVNEFSTKLNEVGLCQEVLPDEGTQDEIVRRLLRRLEEGE